MMDPRALLLPALLLGLAAGPAAFAQHFSAALSCEGIAKQGGLLACSGPADTDLVLETPDGAALRQLRTDGKGEVLIGLARSEAARLVLRAPGIDIPALPLSIAPRKDAFRVVTGLDCDKVDARTEAQKQHAADSWVKKQDAFARFNDGPGARYGFVRPVTGPASSPFGPTRKYVGDGANGEPCEKVSVHEGFDYAVPTGTPVIAPAGGTVVLAEDDLYYEGGTVFLDHGHGLVSVFLHLSEIVVAEGDRVAQGERLAASGNSGRTTGAHLHWAVKWRNPAAEDRDGDFYIDPALLRTLQPRDAAAR